MLRRRHLLCCGAAAVAGLFSALATDAVPFRNPCAHPTLPVDGVDGEWLQRIWEGLDPAQLWDVHAHLIGTGGSGSGCWIAPSLSQWWHPVEFARKRAILNGACVDPNAIDAKEIDRAYVRRLVQLADAFPPGARWLLFAFDEAFDATGERRPDWTTFHVPDGYARAIAGERPDRFGWVASIHPCRSDALERLDRAIAGGALAVKWLPSSMAIDLRDARLRPFYDRLAAARLPLIVHCGEEHAVPGAGRQDLGNPLLLREPLRHGVRVIAAHCASLGLALDLDLPRPRPAQAFDLFARLMDEAEWRELLLGDVSALFQFNRRPEVWRTVLRRQDWHGRLLHGSDYPLPGVIPLVRLPQLVRAGVLEEAHVAPLGALRNHHPLMFDLALKRLARWQGDALGVSIFATARHFAPPRPALPPEPRAPEQ